jgi:hypothetical protein
MVRLAIILIFNKGDAINQAQIETLKQGITKVTDPHDELDENGNVVGIVNTYHYEITNLGVEHELRFYFVLPQGVSKPSNWNDIDAWRVEFGPDQPSHTRRFFNWAIKRSVDHGADAVIYIDDHTQLTLARLKNALQTLAGDRVWVDTLFGKLVEKKVLLRIGQLVEDGMTLAQAITELKQRIQNGGLTSG